MAGMCDHKDNELPVSDLGTKSYWDQLYLQEKNNLVDDGVKPEEWGWFGQRVFLKMISCLPKHFDRKQEKLLDIGCGNGEVVSKLIGEYGCTYVTGFDYSEEAIKLAQMMVAETGKCCELKVVDFVNMAPEDFTEKYRVILDKGTYDAICLNPDVEDQAAVRAKYMENVEKLLDSAGMFIIASCNWTAVELTGHAKQANLHWVHTVPSSVFTFGGLSGDTTTVCAFQKLAYLETHTPLY